jgi:hypothetical protein
LRNPLDYLRLLYWVFFFPQALQWYVDTFGNKVIPEREMTWRMSWRERLEWLHQNPIERQFILQGWILIMITPWVMGVILHRIGVPFNWFGATIGVLFGVVRFPFRVVSMLNDRVDYIGNDRGSEVSWISVLIGFSTMLTLAVSVAVGVMVDINHAKTNILSVLSVVGIAFGLIRGMVSSLERQVGDNTAEHWNGVNRRIVSFLLSRLLLVGFFALVSAILFRLEFIKAVEGSIAFFIAFDLVSRTLSNRLEDWLIGILFIKLAPRNKYWLIPHVTPLPVPHLSSQLTNWLRQDWETGLHNLNQVWVYTLQFIPVTQALNRALAETSLEQLLFRVAQLTSAQLNELRYTWERETELYPDTRFDTPAHAAWYGFWELHKVNYYSEEYGDGGDLQQATRAFAEVRSLPYGEEMFTLTQTLAAFLEADELATIAMLQIPATPDKPLLRPATWEALACLGSVIKDARIVQRSVSLGAQSFVVNRALQQLTTLSDKTNDLPKADLRILKLIASSWKRSLQRVSSKLEEISRSGLIVNPYVVGNPVQGKQFVGREDVLRQLEELWVMGHRLQSVTLYGHRRTGKTSILLNAANYLGVGVKVAYVNLLRLGDSPQGVGEVLMAISDAISEAVDCTPPSDTDLLNIPYRTFERYLKQVEAHLSGGLIVALDEFEKIEELIEAEKIPKDFMGYLRGLVQMSSKVAFAFAGLHTLEEMTADYFQPFFASVIPIHVGFLQPGATRQILANPDEEFPLDYTPEALDQIYALTAGQPYLVQLVGFQLVRRYNDYVFEQGRPRDPVFTIEDVEAVINDPEFFKRGRYYFDGVWGQAARGASGQQAILRALAPHPEGLSIDALAQVTGMEEETLQEALKTLKRHDVVQEREGGWQIIVELFRRWVLQS